ncbi:hypothetical protein B0H14DRAFT_2630960 [Mycena olivaceomarginata]|nr:hypothetical protein B0H14DRAFT_2630960 [Mycena olivaceomarginata]
MKFIGISIATVLQLALAAGIVRAAPAPEDGNPLVISHIVSVGEYNMTYWVDAPGTEVARSLLPRQCGSNDVTCGTSNVANTEFCRQLINALNSGGVTLADSPRAVCLGQGGNQCCVSWNMAVGNMPEAFFVQRGEQGLRDVFQRDLWRGLCA